MGSGMHKLILLFVAVAVICEQASALMPNVGDSNSNEDEDCLFSDKFCRQLQFLGMGCKSEEFKKYCSKYCKDEDCDDGLRGKLGPLIGMFRESNVAIEDMDVSLTG